MVASKSKHNSSERSGPAPAAHAASRADARADARASDRSKMVAVDPDPAPAT